QQEVLVPELRQYAPIGTAIEVRARVADDYQRMAAAQVARARRRPGIGPEAVVAISLLEVGNMLLAERQRLLRLAGTGDKTKPDEIGPRQRTRIIEREVRHDRHPVVLDLAVTQRALALVVIGHQ